MTTSPPPDPSGGPGSGAGAPHFALDRLRPAPAGAAPTIRAAWVIVLTVGTAPAIVWHQITGTVSPWLWPAQMILLAALLAATAVWPTVRPLRRFVVTMIAGSTLLQLTALTDLPWPDLPGPP